MKPYLDLFPRGLDTLQCNLCCSSTVIVLGHTSVLYESLLAIELQFPVTSIMCR